MKKISPSQLVVLLFVTRAFLSTTYGVSQYKINILLSLLSVLVSTAVQLVLILPPLILVYKHPDKDIFSIAFSKSTLLGYCFAIFYGGFFFFETVRFLGIFSYFFKNQFFDFLPTTIIILSLSLIGLYGAKCGIEGLARTSAVGVFIFVIIFFVIIFSVTGEIDVFNLQIASPVSNNPTRAFFSDVVLKTAGSDELVALVFFLPHVTKNHTRATLSYMGIKFFVTEIMIVYSALILGDYANNLSQPFYTLSTYAKTSVIERYDSIYMCVWTIGTVIKVAILIYLLSKSLDCFKIKKTSLVAFLSTTLTAILLALMNMYDSAMFRVPNVVFVAGLCGAFPAFLSLLPSKKEEKTV